MDDPDAMTVSTKTALVLFFLLLALIFLLLFLYKKLNREAEGEYSLRRIVYKEGGVRDRVRGAAVALGSRLGVRLWPGGAPAEVSGEEMREFRDAEGGSSVASLPEGDREEEEEEEARESSDDTSRSLSSEEEEEERDGETEPPKSEEKEAKEEEQQEAGGPEQVRAEAGGGAGLLIDLKQFSGSAIWSEEGSGYEARDDVTAL